MVKKRNPVHLEPTSLRHPVHSSLDWKVFGFFTLQKAIRKYAEIRKWGREEREREVVGVGEGPEAVGREERVREGVGVEGGLDEEIQREGVGEAFLFLKKEKVKEKVKGKVNGKVNRRMKAMSSIT